MMSTKRDAIIEAAMREARAVGYQKITRDGIASAAQCSTGLVNQHFGTIANLRSFVLTRAISVHDYAIIAQGLAVGAPELANIPESMKRQARTSLTG